MSTVSLHPTTLAMLEAQAALDDQVGDRDLRALGRGVDAQVDAAVLALGDALVSWVVAGGPDRDGPEPELNKLLASLWERRLHPNMARALKKHQGAQALSGLPPQIADELVTLPTESLVMLRRIQERIEQGGQIKALQRALGERAPAILTIELSGWDLRLVPNLPDHCLFLLQATAKRLPDVLLLHLWSWLGLTLQKCLRSPARPLRSHQQTEPSRFLCLIGPEGVVATLNIGLPGIDDQRMGFQQALYDLIAALLDAPPVETA